MIELTPIVKPAGWTVEQDLQDFDDRFGEPDNYCRFAMERVAEEYGELIEVVDAAIAYFERRWLRAVS